MGICNRCKNKCKFMLKNKTLDTCDLFEPATNFDRITKTPEALAEFIAKSIDDTIILTNGNRKYTERVVQKEFWLMWLKEKHNE